MRSEHHVVEGENRIVGIRRLGVENVEPGAGEAPFLQRCRQRLLVDGAAARGVHETGGGLHQGDETGVDDVAGLGAQRAIDRQDVGLAAQGFEVDQTDAESRRRIRIRIGVVGDEGHVERLGQAEHLGPDIADADGTERLADEARAHVGGFLREARGPLAGQPVLDQQLAGDGQDQRDDGDGHRAAHAVGRDDQRDVVVRAGGNVHRIVTHAEARDHREPPVGGHARAVEALGEEDQRVMAGELGGVHRPLAVFEIAPLDARIVVEGAAVEHGEGRRTVRHEEIIAQRDPEPVGHSYLLLRCRPRPQRARSASAPSRIACWSSQTSPE